LRCRNNLRCGFFLKKKSITTIKSNIQVEEQHIEQQFEQMAREQVVVETMEMEVEVQEQPKMWFFFKKLVTTIK